jgi:hypothetical protein
MIRREKEYLQGQYTDQHPQKYLVQGKHHQKIQRFFHKFEDFAISLLPQNNNFGRVAHDNRYS